jgi:hypothetical protein
VAVLEDNIILWLVPGCLGKKLLRAASESLTLKKGPSTMHIAKFTSTGRDQLGCRIAFYSGPNTRIAAVCGIASLARNTINLRTSDYLPIMRSLS